MLPIVNYPQKRKLLIVNNPVEKRMTNSQLTHKRREGV